MKKLFFLLVILVPAAANAGWLVKGAQVTLVSNTIGNGETFFIVVKGGSGICANEQINFPSNHAGSEKVHDRAFSVALTAYTSGALVSVYDYDEGSEQCGGAESIRLIK